MVPLAEVLLAVVLLAEVLLAVVPLESVMLDEVLEGASRSKDPLESESMVGNTTGGL